MIFTPVAKWLNATVFDTAMLRKSARWFKSNLGCQKKQWHAMNYILKKKGVCPPFSKYFSQQ